MFSSLYWSCSTGWDPDLCRLLEKNAKILSSLNLRRARGYYLYAEDSRGPKDLKHPKDPKDPKHLKRFYDLYLNGGQALLGHRPAGVNSLLKNVMSRGLCGAFPSAGAERRLHLLLQGLFPEFEGFRIYHNLPAAVELLSEGHCAIGGQDADLWRPLAGASKHSAACLVPVLELSGLPFLVLCRGDMPPSDICSPLQLEALIQGLVLTKKLQRGVLYLELGELRRAFAGQYWLEDGIYLYWNLSKYDLATYAELWQSFWQQGFLLPPNPLAPLILTPNLLDNSRLFELKKAVLG